MKFRKKCNLKNIIILCLITVILAIIYFSINQTTNENKSFGASYKNFLSSSEEEIMQITNGNTYFSANQNSESGALLELKEPSIEEELQVTDSVVDFLKPNVIYKSASVDSSAKTVTFQFDITDKYFSTIVESNVLAQKIKILVNGVDVSYDITKNIILEDIYYTIDQNIGTSIVGKRCTLTLSDLDKGLGDNYSGIYSFIIPEDMVTDTNGNSNSSTTISSEITINPIDIVSPYISVTPSSDIPTKQKDITITISDSYDIVQDSTSYRYFLSTSSEATTVENIGSYTANTEFKIGNGLTGTYYLYVRQVSDVSGNLSQTDNYVTINNIVYHRLASYTFDNTNPTCKIDEVTSPTNKDTISYHITFSESVTGLTKNAFSITEGTAVSLEGSEKEYTLVVSNSGEGTQKVKLGAGKCTDLAENGNLESNEVTVEIDTVSPTCIISADQPSPTNKSTIVYTFTFSEDVTGFALDDIIVEGGEVGTFLEKQPNREYTLVATNTETCTQTVSIKENCVLDVAGNGNTVASISRTIDKTVPTLTITANADALTNASEITYTFEFSKPVEGFELNDIVITDGKVESFAEVTEKKVYTLKLSNSGSCTQTVSVRSGVCEDHVGNQNTSAILSRTIDRTAPTCEITKNIGDKTNASSITYTFTFSEDVTGFDVSDILIENGIAGAFSGSGRNYTLVVNNTDSYEQKVSIPANSCIDEAQNGNEATNKIITLIDRKAPEVSISPVSSEKWEKSKSVTVEIKDEGGAKLTPGSYNIQYIWSTETTAPTSGYSIATINVLENSSSAITTISNNSGNGKYYLYISTASNITDTVGNILNSGHTLTGGQYYIDNTAPTSSPKIVAKQSSVDGNIITEVLGSTSSNIAPETYYTNTKETYLVFSDVEDEHSELAGYYYSQTINGERSSAIYNGGTYYINFNATEEGTTYYVWAKDNANNYSSYTAIRIILDQEGPEVSFSPSAQVDKWSNTISVSVSIADKNGLESGANLQYEWTTTNKEPTNYTNNISFGNYDSGAQTVTSTATINYGEAGKTDGTYYLWIKAVSLSDIAKNGTENNNIIGTGLKSENPLCGEYTIDYKNPTTGPTIKVYANNASGTLKGTVGGSDLSTISTVYTNTPTTYLNFSIDSAAIGNSGLKEFRYSTTNITPNADNTTAVSGDSMTVTINNGSSATYYLWAVDNAGNYSSYYTAVTVECDTITPTIIISPTENNEWRKHQDVTITLNDPGTSGLNAGEYNFEYVWSTSTTAPTSGYTTISFENAGAGVSNAIASLTSANTFSGNYYLYIKTSQDIVDRAGNILPANTAYVSGIYHLDNTKPTCTLSEESDENWSKTKNITVTLADEHAGLAPGISARYGWSTSLENPPSTYETAVIDSYSKGSKSTTFTAIGNNSTDQYYLWIEILTLNDDVVDSTPNNINGTTVKSIGKFYIDNTTPKCTLLDQSETRWTKTKNVTVTLTDEQAGLETGAEVKYGWSTSLDVEPNSYKNAEIATYSAGAPEASFTATGDGLSGRYYLWVKVVKLEDHVREDIKNNINGTIIKSEGTFWMDNQKPICTLSESTDTTWSRLKDVTVTLVDEHSGLAANPIVNYGWSTSNVIEPDAYKTAELNYADGVNSVTFIAEGSELTGPHYLWVKTTKLTDCVEDITKNEINGSIIISEIFNIDNEKPKCTILDNSSPEWSKNKTVRVELTDDQAGLATGANIKYGWSESLDTAPTSYENAVISSYTAGTKNVTFNANVSGLTGKYYLWINIITLNDNVSETEKNNINGTIVKSTGTYWMDNKTPEYSISANSDAKWSKTKEVSITLTDTESGFANDANILYGWSKSSSTYASGTSGVDYTEWKTANLNYKDVLAGYQADNEITFSALATEDDSLTGKFYLWVNIATLNDNVSDTVKNNINGTIVKTADTFWIDNTDPTCVLGTNEDTVWSKEKNVTVTLADAQAGLTNGATIKYGWSKSSSTYDTGTVGVDYTNWTTATLNYANVESGNQAPNSTSFDATAAGLTGKFYLWINVEVLNDNVKDVSKNNINNTTVKSTGMFYMDNTAPVLSELEIINPETGVYKQGEVVTIRATFIESEADSLYVNSSKAPLSTSNSPVLSLKVGERDSVGNTVCSNVNKFTITYTYTIQNGDNGIIAKSTYVGNIYDYAGNQWNQNSANLIGKIITADTIAPVITYQHILTINPSIDKENKKVKITFDVTDTNYDNSTKMTMNDIISIIIDRTTVWTPSDQKITATISNPITITNGQEYVITLENLDTEKDATGDEYMDYSGPVTINFAASKVYDISGNPNAPVTITVDNDDGDDPNNPVIVDVVSPVWACKSVARSSEDNSARLTVRGTDKYFDNSNSSLSSSNITVYVDNVAVTSGITVNVTNRTEIANGVEYQIDVSGFNPTCYQMKIEIAEGTLRDQSGNTNKPKQFIMYNCIKDTSSETSSTSSFLGNATVTRDKVNTITFAKDISGKNDTAWDVSAAQDGSIWAWYTTEGSVYNVTIGSNYPINANTNSSYLFANIGYGSGCTATTIINNLSVLDTYNVRNMSHIFERFGSNKITEFILDANFKTVNVTDMSYMFAGTGYTSMTSFKLGNNFNTDKVTNMAYMFSETGFTKLSTLELAINTKNVTNMRNMFAGTGKTAMTALNLGSNFDTKLVTDMTNMFSECGATSMTSLDLGIAFKNISSTNSGFLYNTGKSASCTILVPETIYYKETDTNPYVSNYVRLNPNSNTTIQYTRGNNKIICNYYTEWKITSNAADAVTGTVVMTLQGSGINTTFTEDSLKDTDITVYENGNQLSGITRSLSEKTTGNNLVTYTLTLTGFKNITSGTISVSVAERKLLDDNQNGNLNLKIGSVILDLIKPVVTYIDSYQDITNKTITAKFEITDEYFDSSSIEKNNLQTKIDVKIDGVSIYGYNTLDQKISLKSCNKTTINKKIDDVDVTGVEYTIIFEGFDKKDGFDYSGTMVISVAPDVASDESGNKNVETLLNLDGTYDVVSPIWKVSDVNIDYEKEEITCFITGSDKFLSNGSTIDTLLDPNTDAITVYVDNVAVTSTVNVEKVLSNKSLTGTTEVRYKLTLLNFEEDGRTASSGKYKNYSGNISLVIAANTLTDLAGNTNISGTYELGFADFIDPEMYQVSSTKNTTDKTMTVVYNIVDKYFKDSISEQALLDRIIVYVDDEEAKYLESSNCISITKSNLQETRNGVNVKYGTQYTVVLHNFREERTEVDESREYADWSGSVRLDFVGILARDETGNTNGTGATY